MARTIAPLLSFGASGAIAKTQVYSTWKGRAYARRHVIPANPRTEEQTKTRSVFSYLNKLWSYMPAGATAAWQLYGDNSRFTARNGWLKQNLPALREAADLADMVMSPAAGSGIAAEAIAVDAGAGSLTVNLTAPALPNGWAIVRAHAMAVRNVDAHVSETAQAVAGSDDAAPYSIALNGLTSGQSYVAGGWFEYSKPDGSRAYGAALQQVAVPL